MACDSSLAFTMTRSPTTIGLAAEPQRVRPELVTGISVPQQFAGSVFDLRPDTDHEIELHAVDPDGIDETWTVTARTRPVPSRGGWRGVFARPGRAQLR